MQTTKEQRQWPRVQAIYAVTFEFFIGSRKLGQGVAESVNISGRGISFETGQLLEPNDAIILWLTSPHYTLHARGLVVHMVQTLRGSYRVGVRLEELLEGDWNVLERDVERLLSEKRRKLHA